MGEQGAAGVTGHLSLRPGKRRPSWYVKYRLSDGRQVRKRLGPAWTEKGRPLPGFLTKKQAETALHELLTDVRRGAVLPPLPNEPAVVFRDVAEEWFRFVRDDRRRKPSTLSDYRSLLNYALLPEFGDLPLEQVTERRIDRYRTRLVAEGRLAPRTINKRLVALHSILRRAQRLHGLAHNAAALVERQPVRSTREIRVYSPEEIQAIARACDVPQDAAIIRTAAYTGLRMGELRALSWKDVDFAKRIVHVRRNYVARAYGAPKSGVVRSVPLSDQAALVLDELSRREDFVAPGDLVFPGLLGQPFDDTALRKRYYAAVDRARVPRLKFHELRHTFGTIAAQAFPITDVQAFLGHANVTTTQIYLHHVPKTDAAERLSRLFAVEPEAASERVGSGSA